MTGSDGDFVTQIKGLIKIFSGVYCTNTWDGFLLKVSVLDSSQCKRTGQNWHCRPIRAASIDDMSLKSTQVEAVQTHDVFIVALGGRTS